MHNAHSTHTLRAETLTQTFVFFHIFKTNCIDTHVFCDCKTWLCFYMRSTLQKNWFGGNGDGDGDAPNVM